MMEQSVDERMLSCRAQVCADARVNERRHQPNDRHDQPRHSFAPAGLEIRKTVPVGLVSLFLRRNATYHCAGKKLKK